MKAVFTFGRMNPVTEDHAKMVQKVNVTARSLNGQPLVFLAHTFNEESDPLSYTEKYKLVRELFGNIVISSEAATLIDIMKLLETRGFKEVVFVTADDLVSQYRPLLEKYNGKEYNFLDIAVIGAGVKNPDSLQDSLSAKMRDYAKAGDLQGFRDLAPLQLKEETILELYATIRDKLGGTDMGISDLNKQQPEEDDRSWILPPEELAEEDLERFNLNNRFESELDLDPELGDPTSAISPGEMVESMPEIEMPHLSDDEADDILNQKDLALRAEVDAELEAELTESTEVEHTPDEVMAHFVTTLLHARTMAHLMHLSTRNYAAHITLNDFYEKLPGLVDTVIESYQGKYGLIEEYPSNYGSVRNEPVKFLTDLNSFVDEMRRELPQDSEIQNEVDSIVTLINSTLYKLKYLG